MSGRAASLGQGGLLTRDGRELVCAEGVSRRAGSERRGGLVRRDGREWVGDERGSRIIERGHQGKAGRWVRCIVGVG